ncbi:DNA polymerase III subunit gamma and tau [Curtobacterium sp. RRHDQ10]|uniref:DNA polymerase III subunit gamma and tau n=1 Tax=Curtobacterium phyllosphaerae TaxID=3413379 RepID=UPI003BF0A8B7
MVTALYRRYRPENFAELIGQSQVTDPLRTALRTNRVNHAYLFSGPRGCGKTTSARILARCLNCAEGPTDTPCGVCPSCVELARDGSGSLDVIEIDAASHNGVDDARDLRDRAIFAPARDRYKIFILDEAHMVTPQGFNALLKLVEEPPDHVKFIFATTEPEKVIGTIRSRTHHYPFRLVPPAAMLEYVEQLCTAEHVTVAPGVLPLVVRAGGGSVRDTLSLLDQLMAGSEDRAIAYDRAVALLGYTDAALLDDVVDALAVADPPSVFAAVDRVVQTGQDPRRFVEDLLERVRDLIVVAATNEGASAVLRGVSPEELDTMTRQAAMFGPAALSRSADIANAALTEMTGATSPRLHLELMVARMLVPEVDDTERGALARVERLERRVGVGDAGGHQPVERPAAGPSGGRGSRQEARPSAASPAPDRPPVASAPVPATAPVAATAPAAASGSAAASGLPSAPTGGSAPASPGARAGTAPSTASGPSGADAARAAGDPVPESVPDVASAAAAAWGTPAAPTPTTRPTSGGSASSAVADEAPAASASAAPTSASVASASSTGIGEVLGAAPAIEVVEPTPPIGTVGVQQMRDSWPQVLEHVQRARRSAWTVVMTAQVTGFADDVLTLTFPSAGDVASFKQPAEPGGDTGSISEYVRAAIVDLLGVRVKFVARGPRPPHAQAAAAAPAPSTTRPLTPERTPAERAVPPRASAPDAAEMHGREQVGQAGQAEQAGQAGQAEQVGQAEQAGQVGEGPRDATSSGVSAAQGTSPAPTSGSAPTPARAPEATGPVTDWAVATIPTLDPGPPVSEDGSAWAPQFGSSSDGPASGSTPPTRLTPDELRAAMGAIASAPVAERSEESSPTTPPESPSTESASPESPSEGQPSTERAVPPRPPAADTEELHGRERDGDEQAVNAPRTTTSAAQGAPDAASTAGSDVPIDDVPIDDVPIDDYPLDDAPYDDGAPFPDPGFGGGGLNGQPDQQRPAPTAPTTTTETPRAAPGRSMPQQSAPALQPSAPAHQQSGPAHQPSAPARQPSAPARQQSGPAQQPSTPAAVRRTPVPGRYGEAVVREILGAQFIEETALDDSGRGGL